MEKRHVAFPELESSRRFSKLMTDAVPLITAVYARSSWSSVVCSSPSASGGIVR
jgi:hypothetical protein